MNWQAGRCLLCSAGNQPAGTRTRLAKEKKMKWPIQQYPPSRALTKTRGGCPGSVSSRLDRPRARAKPRVTTGGDARTLARRTAHGRGECAVACGARPAGVLVDRPASGQRPAQRSFYGAFARCSLDASTMRPSSIGGAFALWCARGRLERASMQPGAGPGCSPVGDSKPRRQDHKNVAERRTRRPLPIPNDCSNGGGRGVGRERSGRTTARRGWNCAVDDATDPHRPARAVLLLPACLPWSANPDGQPPARCPPPVHHLTNHSSFSPVSCSFLHLHSPH
jgi:hypothetical protein